MEDNRVEGKIFSEGLPSHTSTSQQIRGPKCHSADPASQRLRRPLSAVNGLKVFDVSK